MADTINGATAPQTDDEPGCIATGLPLKVMRITMENKSLLSKPGTLYCGTGEIIPVTVGDNAYNIPVTIAVQPPTNGVDEGVTYGIQFEDVTKDSSGNTISVGGAHLAVIEK